MVKLNWSILYTFFSFLLMVQNSLFLKAGGNRINCIWWKLFLVQQVLYNWYNKGCGMYYINCGAYKISLTLNNKKVATEGEVLGFFSFII